MYQNFMLNPLTRDIQKIWHYYNKHENCKFFFKINVYTTCDKEYVTATCMPNPINFYYTSNESILNKLSCSVKMFLCIQGLT